jgi:hypothetical protein
VTDFALGTTVPGIEFPPSFSLTGATAAPVSLRLTDPLLRQDAGSAALAFQVKFVSAQGQIVAEKAFAPPVKLLGGQLELAQLKVTIPTKAGTGGGRVYDASKALAATGSVDWVGAVPQTLGAPGNKISFTIAAAAAAADETFTLQLAAATSLAKVAVDLKSAAASVQILPAEQALVLTVEGQAALKKAAADQATAALKKIFGTKAPSLAPPPFRLRQKLKLADLSVLEPPKLSLFPAWAAAAPTLPSPPQGLDVRLGLPQLDFAFPSLGAAPDFGFLFRDTKLRFPDVAALKAFDLSGNLRFLQQGAGWKLGFEPTMPGTLELPAVLRFLLARIEWMAAATIDELTDLLELSQGEFDWFRQFQGLLPDAGSAPDLALFKTAFDAIVAAALQLPSGPELADLFALAFSALGERADDLFATIVDSWFGHGGSGEELLKLLERLLRELDPTAFTRMLADLFAHASVDVANLLELILKRAGTTQLPDFDALVRLWTRVLGAALPAFPADRLAVWLRDALLAAESAVTSVVKLGDFPFLQGIPGLDLTAFKLPTVTALGGLGLNGLVLASELPTTKVGEADALVDALGDVVEGLRQGLLSLLRPIALPPIDATQVLALLVALFTNAKGDPKSELLLLRLSRVPGINVVLVLAAAIKNLVTSPAPWTKLLFHSVEEDPAYKVKRFPKPQPAGQSKKPGDNGYLILSDIHRDAASDDRGDFEFGSVDHFKANADLYVEILDWADRKNYTVLEGGDSEELWFIRDFEAYTGPKDQLEATIASHENVYDKLVDLHKRGRYFRLYGNHDSQLRDPAVRQPLLDRFQAGTTKKFEIFDYFIVDGVKSMDEHGIGDIPAAVFDASKAQGDRIAAFVSSLAPGHLGLDAGDYTATIPLVVTHGHQFDFWNCDENNLVGKMIANGAAVPLDELEDPLLDMEGIGFSGAPLIDLQEALAAMPVLSNFPSYDPARAFAHRIQHMDDKDRLLVNDIQYQEVIPALVAAFAFPVSRGTAKWSQKSFNPGSDKFFMKYLGVAMSIGHTHYPQSRPYWDTASLLLSPPLKALTDAVREMLAGLLFGFKVPLNVLKAQYYNSGTASWMEGVIWAIEIDSTGLARLVYWTRDTRIDAPQEMDWELQTLDDARRQKLQAKREQLAKQTQEWVDRFAAVIAAAGAGVAALSSAAVLAIADLLATGGPIVHALEEAPAASPLDEIERRVDDARAKVADVLLHTLLTLVARQMNVTTGTRSLQLVVPLPPAVGGRLAQLEGILDALPDVPAGSAAHHAAVWLAASEKSPVVGGPQRGGLALDFPVLWQVLTLLPSLPASVVDLGAAHLDTDVSLAGGKLTLTLTVT